MHWQQARRIALHLGCGRRIMPGWVNVDAVAGAGIDLVWDLRYRLPFATRSATMIYSEHLLEHLPKRDALALLAESYRILEPGGRIRIGVPDAELYLRAYAEQQTDFFRELRHLGGTLTPLETPIDVINHMFRMGGHHQFAWDYQSLAHALQSIGFEQIARWPAGRASCPALCLDDPAHAFETLYVEASRPLVEIPGVRP